MRLRTLFEAYAKVRSHQDTALGNRPGGLRGIAVHTDRYAKTYQRYARLERKLYRVIVRRLGGKDDGKLCHKCGYPQEFRIGCEECRK